MAPGGIRLWRDQVWHLLEFLTDHWIEDREARRYDIYRHAFRWR